MTVIHDMIRSIMATPYSKLEIAFWERQRQRSAQFLPDGELTEEEFRAALFPFSRDTLRHASNRWLICRGRTREIVLERLIEVLKNPNVNRGESFAVALSIVRAQHAAEQRGETWTWLLP